MLRLFAFFLILLTAAIADTSASAQGDPSWSKWQQAHSLYDQGKFQEAFAALSAEPSNDPTYFYDLGTIAYRLGRIGAALGYFEKANRLRPHDPDVRHSLEVVRSDLDRTLGADRLDPASTWAESLADQVSLEEIRSVLGLIGLLLALFCIQTYWKNRDFVQTVLRPGAVLGGIALLVLGTLYGIETWASSHSPAIALSRQPVRSGPGDTYVELGDVDAGVKVRLLGPSSAGTTPGGGTSSENWLQVRYSQDGIGWVRASGFLVID